MSQNRKTKPNFQSTKLRRSVSTKKRQPRESHLLAKPAQRKTSMSKMAQSFSTLNSYNFSKSSTNKLRSKAKVPNNKELQREIDKMAEILQEQYRTLEGSSENKQNQWYGMVEQVSNKASNKTLKLLMKSIQIGYSDLGKKNNNAPPRKQGGRLTLNIEKIKKQEIPDYQDQFMSNADKFSPSWREMFAIQQKRTVSRH